jgi:hypothetical protein
MIKALRLALLAFSAAAGWSPFGAGVTLPVQQQQFQALAATDGVFVAAVFARQHNSEFVAVGDASMRQKDTRPWLPVGRIVAPSAASVTAAIETQRPLLVTAAKAGHKKLRVLRDFSLAWGSADELEAEEPRLGSFRCPACGAQNDASADDCTNCGTPRGDAPRGSLSLALRTSKLEVEQCGFEPAPG